MTLPSTRSLEAFASVARLGSLKAAAADLSITISAVNQRIHSLELLLETKLFAHKQRRLQLTGAGTDFLQQVVPIIDALRMATERLQQDERQRSSLKVATTPILHSRWLAPRLQAFRDRYPHAAIELLTLNDEIALTADVLIQPNMRGTPQRRGHPLLKYEVFPVCTIAMRDELKLDRPQDLVRATLLDMTPPLAAWRSWFAMADISGLKCDWLVVDSHQVMLDAAVLGMGVAITASFLMDQLFDDGLVRLFDIACPMPGTVEIVIREGDNRKIVRAFRDWLIEAADQPIAHDKPGFIRRSAVPHAA